MKYNKLTSLLCTFCTCVHCELVYTVKFVLMNIVNFELVYTLNFVLVYNSEPKT